MPNPSTLSGGSPFCMGQSGRQGTLQLPQFAPKCHLWDSWHHRWDLFLLAHTDKKQRDNPGWGSARMVGLAQSQWALRIKVSWMGIPRGPQKHPSQLQEERIYIGIAKRGDAKPAPTCKNFQEAKMGCLQHALGQRRIVFCLFSTCAVWV